MISKLLLFVKTVGYIKGDIITISKKELILKEPLLNFNNGGDWCRRSNCINSEFKIATLKKNKIEYLWNDYNHNDTNIVKYHFSKYDNLIDNSNSIIALGIFGENLNLNNYRPIRKDIKNYYKKLPCCACGSTYDLVCDHKNDLYNDKRVLNINTQTFNDFQSLCIHCNLQKRQVLKKTKETNKRYKATNIPSLKIFGIDFIYGNEKFNYNDPNAMVGTYWYDPIEFMKKIKEKL
jgi:hypothetical protein